MGRTDRFKDIFEEVYESGWKVKFEAAKIFFVSGSMKFHTGLPQVFSTVSSMLTCVPL